MRRLVLASLVLVAACGDDDEVADPVAEAEAGIAEVVADRLGPDAGDVTVACPDSTVLDPGATFTCRVTVGTAAPVDLALGVAGDGTVELRRAVIPTDDAEAYLAGELAGPAEGAVIPDCGEAPLLVASVGEELRCTAVRTADGTTHDVVVTVLALDGTVRYRVEAPGSVTGSPPP